MPATLMSWLIPIALFFMLWGSLAKKAGMSSGWLFDVGKSKARVYVASMTGVTFDDVAGIDHARQVTLSGDVDLSVIAARTAGFAGADLANLVNEAALLAGRSGKDMVDMSDFDEAIDRIVAGLQKKTRVVNKTEKETVAYHEAGHALIAEFRKHADRVAKISIIPRGIAALGLLEKETLDRAALDVLLKGRGMGVVRRVGGAE